jgi:uncharacterized cupin superfamily protein
MARTGQDIHPIQQGDFIGYPKGGTAQEIRNTRDVPLRFLVISQRLTEYIVDYPDQAKHLYLAVGRVNDLVDVVDIMYLDCAD